MALNNGGCGEPDRIEDSIAGRVVGNDGMAEVIRFSQRVS